MTAKTQQPEIAAIDPETLATEMRKLLDAQKTPLTAVLIRMDGKDTPVAGLSYGYSPKLKQCVLWIRSENQH